ncbi:hypothetical protein IU487_22260 [Nocardia puris]|uniref:hypothetical protein n=1 Tax=Nocardia puris TaxID=208602 RepID=UPI00189328A5|nr:hypothetical protein [Nocardia puris]MBF6213744.1 hypothetical protein [Nocardia puris]
MTTYLGLKAIGEQLGVSAATVSKWRTRYEGTDHPTPAPDIHIDDTPGWVDATTWKVWDLSRPGRGVGGGPLPLARARQEYEAALQAIRAERGEDRPGRLARRALVRIAETYGTDPESVIGLSNRLAHDNPDMADDYCDVTAVAMSIRSARKSKTA